MSYPISIYFYEFKWRFVYIFFSNIICILILLNYFQILILLKVFPLFKINHNRLIAIHVTDLFNIIFLICYYLSIIWIFPLLIWQIKKFLFPRWTKLQLQIFEKICNLLWIFFNLFIFTFHFKCIPIILKFFLAWEIKNKYSYLQLEIESRINDYFFWIWQMNAFFTIFLILIIFIIIVILLLFGSLFLYSKIKFYKKQLIFLIFVIFSFLLPFDINSQLLFLINLTILYEIIFLNLCFILSKSLV